MSSMTIIHAVNQAGCGPVAGTGLLSAGTAGQATGAPLWVAMASAMLVGLGAGILQGGAIVKLRVPPFIATLGGITVLRGMALVLSGGQPISTFPPQYTWLGQGMIGPVPVPVIIFLMFAVIGHVILHYTRYGRSVYAVGGNPEAARLSGLNTAAIIVSVYVISGFLAGFSGFLLSSRLKSAEQVAGVGYELTVIAGVVIGGTSFSGGEGNIPGTVIGILLIGVLSNGLTLMNVSPYYQQILTGLIIVFAVAFDQGVKGGR
jgi:ribose/xylose/arabinose/galactoside ABC-type transport system permease subunit